MTGRCASTRRSSCDWHRCDSCMQSTIFTLLVCFQSRHALDPPVRSLYTPLTNITGAYSCTHKAPPISPRSNPLPSTSSDAYLLVFLCSSSTQSLLNALEGIIACCRNILLILLSSTATIAFIVAKPLYSSFQMPGSLGFALYSQVSAYFCLSPPNPPLLSSLLPSLLLLLVSLKLTILYFLARLLRLLLNDYY